MMNMSVLAALAGMMFVARSTASGPFDGVGWELDAIAAVFIGGAAVSGGVGTVIGSIVGGLVMAVLNNGLQLLGVGADATQIIKGLVLLVAVALDVYNKTQGKPSIIGLLMRNRGSKRSSGGDAVEEPSAASEISKHRPDHRLSELTAALSPHPHTRVPPGREQKGNMHMRLIAKVVAVTAVAALALTGCGRASDSGSGGSGGGSGSTGGQHGFAARTPPSASRCPQKTSENWVLAEGLFNDGLKQAGFKPATCSSPTVACPSSRTRSRP